MGRAPTIYVRNIIFGVEDSLVSTVGFLSGLAFVGMPKETVVLAGLIYIFVEGFSMAMGSFLSEESAQEYETRREVPVALPVLGALSMLVSSIVAGLIPIFPYLFSSGVSAIAGSIAVSLAALGILGFVHARVSGLPALPRVFRMMLLGGAAIGIGFIVGGLFSAF